MRAIFLFFLSSVCVICAADSTLPPSEGLQEPHHLVIRNRILTKVHNSTISVLDVVKKMELFLHRYYPQYMDSPSAKYQFFSSQWRDVLLQMIDHELILADAEKMELKVTDSEVRETLFERFGPNIMLSLSKIGLSYEEARAIVHADLVVQRMTWFKVHAKALSHVNNQDIKKAYVAYLEKNPPKETWQYRILSVRSSEKELAEKTAILAHSLCLENPGNLEKVVEEVGATIQITEGATPCSISLSELVTSDTKNLSSAYKSVLSLLNLGSCSTPICKESKDSTTYRIFFLLDHTTTPQPSFRALYNQLQAELVQQAADKESKIYQAKLRKRYGFTLENLTETVPSDFQPFALQ